MSHEMSEKTAGRPTLRGRLFSRHTQESSGSATLESDSLPKRRKVPFYSSTVVSNSANELRFSRRKPSFVSRMARRVIPCVAPSSMDLDLDLNHTKSTPPKHSSRLPPPDIVVPNGNASTSSPHHRPSSRVSRPTTPMDGDVIVNPPASAHLLPDEETDGVTSGAVQPPGSTVQQGIIAHGGEISEEDESDASFTDYDHDQAMIEEQEEEERLIRSGGNGIPTTADGKEQPLLPPILSEHTGRKCLVLDLDETLVHSSFKAVNQCDFIVPVEIEYHVHQFHVLKRPGVDDFLKRMGEIYEIVVFTASLSKYADPVLDQLDIHKVVAHRLFRESCYSHKGNYVKDLSQLGRPIADTIILDNSPASYIFHPTNAVPVSSWFNDPHDAELTDLVPFLADLTSVPDVRGILNTAA